jgi:hypothetical protein
MFSATTSKGLERIACDILGDCSILKFKSEFEMINKVSSVSSGIIKTFPTKEEAFKALSEEIKKNLLQAPMVIIQDLD